ncbi:hypothetical protein [Serratia marcescens]|uniref:hypothetical protein n=1 Tax=Serratia marcescens TaxID=615 RepID=UPI003AAC4D6C
MNITDGQKQTLIDTCNVMINREVTSDYSANLREVALIALSTLTADRDAQPVAFDVLADAVKEVTGGIRVEFAIDTYKGHQPVPFMNFTSLSRVVEMFRIAPPTVPRVIVIPEAATLTNINQLCPLDNNLSQTDFATGWNDCRQHALTHDRLPPVIKGVHAVAQGWNACRVAMLAVTPKVGK